MSCLFSSKVHLVRHQERDVMNAGADGRRHAAAAAALQPQVPGGDGPGGSRQASHGLGGGG